MPPEKINNAESKESQVSDKEGKKLDGTSSDEVAKVVNEKDIKTPTTTPGEEVPVPNPTEPDPNPTKPDPDILNPTDPDPTLPTTTPGEEEVPVPNPTDPDPIREKLSNNKENKESTNPVKQLTPTELYNQKIEEKQRQVLEKQKQLKSEEKTKFNEIFKNASDQFQSVVQMETPITSMTKEEYKKEILEGNFQDVTDYLNNSINGKQIKSRNEKIKSLENIKNMLSPNVLVQKGLRSFIYDNELTQLISKIETSLSKESLGDASLINFFQKTAFIEVSPLLAQKETQRVSKEANEKANETFEKSKVAIMDSLNTIITGSDIAGFKEISQDNFLLIKGEQVQKYLIQYNKFIDDYSKINKDISNRETRLNKRDSLDNKQYKEFKKNYPKEKIQEIILSKQEDKSEMEFKLGSIINNTKIDINSFMPKFTENQKDFIERNTYVEKHEGEIIKTENPAIIIETTPQTQKVGEFIELSTNDKENISSQMKQLVEKDQEIVDIAIIGKADSTIPINEKIIDAQNKKSIESLVSKGFKIILLDNIEVVNQEDFDNPDKYSEQQKYVNILNQKRAFNRALMQIDFLSSEQIKKINQSQNFTIILDAQTVGDETKKGNQYTGGSINIESKGSYTEEILPGNEVKISPELIDIPQITSDIIGDTEDGQGNVSVNSYRPSKDKQTTGNPDRVRVVSTRPSVEGAKKQKIYQMDNRVARDRNGMIKKESFVTGIIRDLKRKSVGADKSNPWAARPGSRR